MYFAFDDTQLQFRSVVRGFLEKHASETHLRRVIDGEVGYDADVWKKMAQSLGLQGIAIPDQYGGSGAGLVELGLVVRELGRAATPTPFFSSAVLAAFTILSSGDQDQMDRLLPKIASGESLVSLAYLERPHSGEDIAILVTARQTDGGWLLSGTKRYVVDGGTADLLLVLAETPGGPSLFVVLCAEPTVAVTRETTLDPTRRLASVTLTDAPAVLLGSLGVGRATVRTVLDIARIVLASEQVGVARRALEIAVSHAQVRHQFGQAIGSFQAVKHLCANMLVAVETAEAAADYGLLCAENRTPELSTASPMVGAYCSSAAVSVTKDAVQVLGGIGFTWEHPMHFYLKRAKSNSLLLGSPSENRETMLRRMAL